MEAGHGRRQQIPLAEEKEKGGDNFSWPSAVAFAFLTYNTATAAYRFAHDRWALAFVLTAYADQVGLFWCLWRFERSEAASRPRLKVAIWLLATLLTAMFSHKVASIMPWPIAALVWATASATALGGFYAFFLYREPPVVKEQN